MAEEIDDIEKIIDDIVDMADDDWYGFWEILGIIDYYNPNLDKKRLIDEAIKILRHLYEIEYIEIYEGYNFPKDGVLLSDEQSMASINNIFSWDPENAAKEHCRFTTKERKK